MSDNPKLVLTPGDINGIGPEVTLKALNRVSLKIPLIILAPPSVYRFYAQRCDIPFSGGKEISNITEATEPGVYFLSGFKGTQELAPLPGELTIEAGKLSMLAIEYAADLCVENPNIAMITAPISKEAVNKAGFNITGHTEYLAERDNCNEYVMMLASSLLRVVPVSTHVPISMVPAHITEANILKKLNVLNACLKNDFGIEVPRIAIMGLNPHAGDGGILGTEELEIIRPAMEKAYKQKIHCEGPYAADGFFAAKRFSDYDAILAMYHDQGLIPFKTLTFNGGINFTAGLSFIRTSPDHGTAYGIAGLNRADYGSMREAIEMAQFLIRRRKSK
jgi:4-hydroxythreonine-4-phosphate dehydrogenase